MLTDIGTHLLRVRAQLLLRLFVCALEQSEKPLRAPDEQAAIHVILVLPQRVTRN